MAKTKNRIWIDYTNYKGERGMYQVRPRAALFTWDAFHGKAAWVLGAEDVKRRMYREFLIEDIHAWGPSVSELSKPPVCDDGIVFFDAMAKMQRGE